MSTSEGCSPVRVKLGNDYGLRWPVWFHNDVLDVESEAPITPQLKGELRRWAAYFEEHHSYPGGWDAVENREVHDLTGHDLRRRLQAELGDGYAVELNLWAR